VADRPSDPAGGVPNQFWATLAATQSIPLGVARTAAGRWGASGRTAMPDGTASGGHGSIRRTSTRERPVFCVNAGNVGLAGSAHRPNPGPGPPSTPTALTRCAPSQQRSQPDAQSTGQRRIASSWRAAGWSARCTPRAFAGPPRALAATDTRSLNHGHRAGWWPSVRHGYRYALAPSGPRRGV